MGWFRRRKPDNAYGYEDRAALKGVGGYEPTDPADLAPNQWGATVSSADPAPGTAAGPPTGTPPSSFPTAHASLPEYPGTDTGGTGGGTPGGAAAPEPGSRQPSGAGVGLGCVLVLMLVTGVSTYLTSESDNEAVPQAELPSSLEPSSEYSPPAEVRVPPAVAGWQPVVGSDGEYAYDVPRSWSPEARTLHGWYENPHAAKLTLSTSAFLGEGHCAADKESRRGGSGVTTVEQADPARATEAIASRALKHAYTADGDRGPKLRVNDPVKTTVSWGDRRLAATLTFAEATVRSRTDPCLPETALAGAIAVAPPGGGDTGAAVLVVYADQSYSGAPTRKELTRLLESLRWVPEQDRSTVPATPSSTG